MITHARRRSQAQTEPVVCDSPAWPLRPPPLAVAITSNAPHDCVTTNGWMQACDVSCVTSERAKRVRDHHARPEPASHRSNLAYEHAGAICHRHCHSNPRGHGIRNRTCLLVNRSKYSFKFLPLTVNLPSPGPTHTRAVAFFLPPVA